MDYQDKLRLCNLTLELKLERCDSMIDRTLVRSESPNNNVSNGVKKSTLKTANSIVNTTRKLKKPGKRGRPKKNPVEENTKEEGIPKRRKKSPKLCWGCLEEGDLKNMHVSHYSNGLKENYSDMIWYCFSIRVTTRTRLNYICGSCILKLRDVLRFKKQFCIAQNYLNQVTGGQAVKAESYTGQTEVNDPKGAATQSNPSASQVLTTEMSATNLVPMVGAHSLTASSDGLGGFQFPGGTNNSPIALIPVQSGGSPGLFFVSNQGPQTPIILQSPNQIRSNHIMQPRYKNKYVIIKKTLPSPPVVSACDGGGNQVHEIPSSDEEDDVQVVAEDEAESDSIGSRYSKDTGMSLPFHSTESFIPEEECSQKSEYITCDNFILRRSKSTEDLFNSIQKTFNMHSCPLCHDGFGSVSERREHLQNDHMGVFTARMCEECGAKFKTKHLLQAHVKKAHLHIP